MTAPARWPLNYLTSHGPRADPVTGLTWFLLGLSVLVVLIFAVGVGVGVVLRRQPTPEHFTPSGVARGGSGLAWIYIGMPLTVVALAVALFWTMAVLARIDHPATRPRLTIEVTGRQWWWQVRYLGDAAHPGFETANEIHVPVGEPVLIQLRGGDVIHSFWVPALTGKTDTIPGRNNVTWMQADKPGLYRGQCTEYCGLQHANMGVFIHADARDDFERWRLTQAKVATTSGGVGEAVFVQHCGKCHSIQGTQAHGDKGPDLTHVASRDTLAAGVLTNTIGNLSGWISDPQGRKPGALMPATYLSGPELRAVTDYLERLR